MRGVAPAAWILVSSLLFATMSALVKIAAADVSLSEIIFFRNLPSVLVLFAYSRLRGYSVRTICPGLHIRRSLIGITGMTLGFYAISRLPLATATTLDYTAPLFLLLAYVVVSPRQVRFGDGFTMLIGFVGVVLLLGPTVHANQLVPFVAGLGGGACAAVAYRMVWRLGRAREPGWRIVFYYALAATLASMASMPFAPASTYTPQSVSALVGVGVVGLFAQLSMTHAFQLGSTSLLATLQYSTVIFAAAYGLAFWGDRLSLAGFAGLVLIVSSGVLAVRNLSKQQRTI